MTTRRRLGPGPAEHRSPAATDSTVPGPVPPRVQAADADLNGGALYRPDLDSLADMRARGVLGHRPAAPDPGSRTYGHGAGTRAES
ncbi:hypothetical protein [Streptomyces sp. ML-6]|uniref:hypothetical protein n=1 Tax=Streptomyces sp. ML-6 TaxID=2982693 RepID=UPI0024C09D73|nr:hypothetical protein [Streptomyces sp. ML-6]MDK0524862.1 hypothetical protein [Streptomyces sp. ML-6]